MNRALTVKRGKPEKIQRGDIVYVPIPWKFTTKPMPTRITTSVRLSGAPTTRYGVDFQIRRDGEPGEMLRWVQTVDADNYSTIASRYFVDPARPDEQPPETIKPYYRTDAELSNSQFDRTLFRDRPGRVHPKPNTTHWRAVLSLAVVRKLGGGVTRITLADTVVWGFSLEQNGAVTPVKARTATPLEISGHLRLLRRSPAYSGFRFRTPPGVPLEPMFHSPQDAQRVAAA